MGIHREDACIAACEGNVMPGRSVCDLAAAVRRFPRWWNFKQTLQTLKPLILRPKGRHKDIRRYNCVLQSYESFAELNERQSLQ